MFDHPLTLQEVYSMTTVSQYLLDYGVGDNQDWISVKSIKEL